MVKKPKAQLLKDRIQKSTDSSEIDPDWQSHFVEFMGEFDSLEKLENFSLLSPDKAKAAYEMLSTRLEQLENLKKTSKAVETLLIQKKFGQ